MNNLIILEGPDNTGKTTLAKEILARVNRGCYLHGTKVGDEKCQRRYHLNFLEIAKFNIEEGENVVVMDRHWISHLVYSRVDGLNKSEYGEKFKKLTACLKPVYVFCDSEKGEAEYEKNIDPDHPYTLTEYDHYCRRYRDIYLAMSQQENVFLYDFTQHGKNKTNLDHFISLILDDEN